MPRKRRIHAIYSTLGPQGGIGSHECMLFTALCHPRNGSDRHGSDECMLFTALWVLSVVSDQGNKECMLFTILWASDEISEATIVCYLQHVGPQGGIGGHDCMLFTARWAPREVSEATIACYLRHVGLPGRYRRPRLYAIYDTLGHQGGIGGHDCMLFTTLWAPREVSARQARSSYGARFGVIFIGVEPTRPAHS